MNARNSNSAGRIVSLTAAVGLTALAVISYGAVGWSYSSGHDVWTILPSVTLGFVGVAVFLVGVKLLDSRTTWFSREGVSRDTRVAFVIIIFVGIRALHLSKTVDAYAYGGLLCLFVVGAYLVARGAGRKVASLREGSRR